jgi:ribosomal protein S18 acetylase RimI-like enzyme
MARHTSGKQALQTQYPKLWYLEVIAVHPSLQSRGLGGAVMRAILEQVAGNPIFLECTRQENIAFYEGFGFKTIEEVELADTPAHANEDGKLKYWVMVRETHST